MNNYINYNQNQNFQPYQISQYFPQPQGNVYMINTSNDVANVPISMGLSAAICLKEGIMYLKTIQNGNPILLGYRLSPFENSSFSQEQNQIQSQNNFNSSQPQNIQGQNTEQRILQMLEDFDSRLKKLENLPEKHKGGTSEWQL